MRLRLVFTAFLSAFVPAVALAQASIEGRVELPKTHSAPVMSKRYEVVTKGGVLATNPPLAVVSWKAPSGNRCPRKANKSRRKI